MTHAFTLLLITLFFGRYAGLIPLAAKLGLFALSMVLLGASISYIGALRAARRHVMRTKLLPESVDQAITRSREHAFDRVRRRFKKLLAEIHARISTSSLSHSPASYGKQHRATQQSRARRRGR